MKSVFLILLFLLNLSIAKQIVINKRLPSGIEIGVSNRVILKLKNDNLNYFLKKYKLTKVKQLSKNIYLLEAKSVNKALEIIKDIKKEKNVIYVYIDYIKKRVLR